MKSDQDPPQINGNDLMRVHSLRALLATGVLTPALAFSGGMSWLLSYFLVINGVAFAYHGLDKTAAQRDQVRIPERFFFILVAAGGALGTLVAMKLFRHKIRKVSYHYWITVCTILHVLVWYVFQYFLKYGPALT